MMTKHETHWDQFTLSLKGAARVILGQSLLINVALLTVPVYTLQIFDRVLLSGSVETLFVLLAGALIVCLGAFYVEHLRRQVMMSFATYMREAIDPLVLASSTKSDSDRQLLVGLENFKQQLRAGSLTALFDSIWIPIAVLVSFIIHPIIGLFVLAINLTLGVCAWYKFRSLAPAEKAQLTKILATHDQLLCSNANTAWLTQNGSLDQYRQLVTDPNAIEGKQTGAALLYGCQYAMKWLFQLGLPTLGAGLLLTDQLTVGGFLAALIVASRTLMPLDAILGSIFSIRQHADLLPELKTHLLQQPHQNKGFEGEFKGDLHLKGISTAQARFPQTRLENINLIAKTGAMVGLIGETGSGVPDLLRVITGELLPTTGETLFDDIRVSDWDQQSLAHAVSWLTVDVEATQQTIRNIITHQGQVNDSQAISVATQTGLNDALVHWGLDYDALIEESWLSNKVGQQIHQLTLLTATLSREAKLIVLENPEQYLSIHQLNRFKQCLGQRCQAGTTVVLGTESNLMLDSCNAVYWLDQGSIVRSGTPAAIQQQEASQNVRSIR